MVNLANKWIGCPMHHIHWKQQLLKGMALGLVNIINILNIKLTFASIYINSFSVHVYSI
jgi:hypothetical protein